MPGGEPLWPGKPPNPGGRPYGGSIEEIVSGLLTTLLLRQGERQGELTRIRIVCHDVRGLK
jgi:hypothetical protein